MEKIFANVRQLFKFGLVGILNTVVGTMVMFFAYNVLNMGYWFSSAMNYIVGSILSYFLNKYFTFGSKKRSKREVIRFLVNIALCYLLAYGLAQSIVKKLIVAMDISMKERILEQVAMIFGMCFFVVLNFLGQKLFVFKDKI